jgi:hypothetical protein
VTNVSIGLLRLLTAKLTILRDAFVAKEIRIIDDRHP